jgi:hypothetical protein
MFDEKGVARQTGFACANGQVFWGKQGLLWFAFIHRKQ